MSHRAWILLVTGAVTVLFTVAATSGAQDAEPGERLMNAACQDCHTVRPIQTQAMNADGWTRRITQEIERGAKLAKDDVPTLVEFLVRTHGPVPEGPGREVLLNTCTRCHDLFRIKFGRRSPEEWEETLMTMLNEGADLSDESFALIHHYLSTNYGLD